MDDYLATQSEQQHDTRTGSDHRGPSVEFLDSCRSDGPDALGGFLDDPDGDGVTWLDVVLYGHTYDVSADLRFYGADSGLRREFVLRHFGESVRSDRVAGVARCRHPRSSPGAPAADCGACRAVASAVIGPVS